LLIWMGIAWFYLRPKEIRKHEGKLNNLIAKFEEVNNQLIS